MFDISTLQKSIFIKASGWTKILIETPLKHCNYFLVVSNQTSECSVLKLFSFIGNIFHCTCFRYHYSIYYTEERLLSKNIMHRIIFWVRWIPTKGLVQKKKILSLKYWIKIKNKCLPVQFSSLSVMTSISHFFC